MAGAHNQIHDMDQNEQQIFKDLIRPDDSYDENGVYWADMPLAQRIKFVGNYDAKEAGRELASVGRMFRANPLSPLSYYFRNTVIPGAGLGLEG